MFKRLQQMIIMWQLMNNLHNIISLTLNKCRKKRKRKKGRSKWEQGLARSGACRPTMGRVGPTTTWRQKTSRRNMTKRRVMMAIDNVKAKSHLPTTLLACLRRLVSGNGPPFATSSRTRSISSA